MMRAAFERRGRAMHEQLSAIDGVTCLEPQGAFYCFPNVSGLLGRDLAGRTCATTLELADHVLSAAKVAFVPGEAFGAARLRQVLLRPRRCGDRGGHRPRGRRWPPPEPVDQNAVTSSLKSSGRSWNGWWDSPVEDDELGAGDALGDGASVARRRDEVHLTGDDQGGAA